MPPMIACGRGGALSIAVVLFFAYDSLPHWALSVFAGPHWTELLGCSVPLQAAETVSVSGSTSERRTPSP